MGPDLRCVECRTHSGLLALGWVAVRCEDFELNEPPELAFYCPDCAQVEFGIEARRARKSD